MREPFCFLDRLRWTRLSLFFRFPEISGILDSVAAGKDGELLQTHIQSDSRAWASGRENLHFHGKNRVPLARLRPLDNDGLDGVRNLPVQSYLDRADLGELQLAVLNRGSFAVAELGEGNGLVPTPALEPGIAWRLTVFQPAEKPVERPFRPEQHLLGDLGMDLTKIGVCLFRLFEPYLLLDAGDGALLFLPGFFPLGQGGVVYPPAGF